MLRSWHWSLSHSCDLCLTTLSHVHSWVAVIVKVSEAERIALFDVQVLLLKPVHTESYIFFYCLLLYCFQLMNVFVKNLFQVLSLLSYYNDWFGYWLYHMILIISTSAHLNDWEHVLLICQHCWSFNMTYQTWAIYGQLISEFSRIFLSQMSRRILSMSLSLLSLYLMNLLLNRVVHITMRVLRGQILCNVSLRYLSLFLFFFLHTP